VARSSMSLHRLGGGSGKAGRVVAPLGGKKVRRTPPAPPLRQLLASGRLGVGAFLIKVIN
jgi:hypothetical protein